MKQICKIRTNYNNNNQLLKKINNWTNPQVNRCLVNNNNNNKINPNKSKQNRANLKKTVTNNNNLKTRMYSKLPKQVKYTLNNTVVVK